MLKSIFLILILVIIVNTHAYYTPQIEANLRTGNLRSISRTSLLIPIQDSSNHLFFLNLIGMVDSQKAFEGNMGLGYRRLCYDYIIGAYSFFDLRHSQFNNTFR